MPKIVGRLTYAIDWVASGIVLFFVCAAAYGFIRGCGWFPGDGAGLPGNRSTGWAVLLASACMLGIIGVLKLGSRSDQKTQRRELGWIGVILGADGRLSTSKVQVLLWTFGVAFALAYLGGVAAFKQVPVLDVEGTWSDYLILLGGPFAAAVLAKLAVVTKLENGTVSKPLVPGLSDPQAVGAAAANDVTPPSAAPGGLVTGDSGNLDVIDTQYVVFNLVAFVYAASIIVTRNFQSGASSIEKYNLPVIPAVLLGLTSVAAVTYVGNKAVQQTGPKITSLTPQPAKENDVISVHGVNLVPPETSSPDAEGKTKISLAYTPSGAASITSRTTQPVLPGATAVLLTFTLPAWSAGTATVAVVTTAGTATDPVQLTIGA